MVRPRFAATMLCGMLASAALAAPEDLDPAFGDGGIVALAGPITRATHLRVLPDDRTLVVVGTFDERWQGVVWRLGVDGRPDPSFGTNGGMAAAPLCPADRCAIVDIAVAGDRIYLLLSEFRVARLHADGTPDATFGSAGVASLSGFDSLVGLAVDDVGRPIVFGHASVAASTGLRGMLHRLKADGSPDAGFGDDPAQPGSVFLEPDEAPAALVPGLGGGLVVLANLSTPPWSVYLRRFTAAGRPEPPTVQGAWRETGSGRILRRDAAGRLLVGGIFRGIGAPGVVRLAGDIPDVTFGDQGFAAVPMNLADLVVDPQGRVLATGYLADSRKFYPWTPDYWRMAVTRLRQDGTPDPHFAPAGSTAFRLALGSHGVAIGAASGGRVLVAGAKYEDFWGGNRVFPRDNAIVVALQGGATAYPRPDPEDVAIEYRHRAFGHYFVSAGIEETRRLDTDPAWTAQWTRTGLAFNVWAHADGDRVPVCRFWSGQRFAPKSSHFYTPIAAECNALQHSADWSYEGQVFALELPDAGSRACPSDARPLYRVFNNGQGGAPNHRYTTEPAVLDAMIAQGWTLEGDAATRVFACVPRHD